MFAPEQPPTPWWRVVAWWEVRRIPYNILVGLYGVFCLFAFFWAITTSGRLPPGEDAVEPMALLVAPFALNLCYTLGWLMELTARILLPSLSLRFGPFLLKLGIAFSMFLISIPAALWCGVRLLQVAHLL
jgi:hypothetical protein